MTAFTFQLALLFFPGIICGLIVEQLAVQGSGMRSGSSSTASSSASELSSLRPRDQRLVLSLADPPTPHPFRQAPKAHHLR